MVTDAKLILESICIGYALCSASARKAMVDGLPAYGWEGVTGELFDNVSTNALFNETLCKNLQIAERPDKIMAPMAFIVEVLKKENAITRTLNMLQGLRKFLDHATVKDLGTLTQMHEAIIRSQGNGKAQEATTGPAHSVPAPQPMAHGAGNGKAPTPDAGQRKE